MMTIQHAVDRQPDGADRGSGRPADGRVPPIREFQRRGEPVWWNAVTYGPLSGGFTPARCDDDFRRIARAGFNVIRLYALPERWLLDLAETHGIGVVAGLDWGQHADFLRQPGLVSSAMVSLDGLMRQCGGHAALWGVLVGNEIPADLVRWMGPYRVRQVIESLIDLSRCSQPDLPVGYANFPTTEYLEPENATFSAFNLYLEDPDSLRAYLKRLHHVAGDRPLWISEFGLDSRRHGTLQQAETLAWARRIAREEHAAGFTVFAWSDDWWNRGGKVADWDFGLTDRQGNDKPALHRLADPLESKALITPLAPAVSIIVCTYCGKDRIGPCLDSLLDCVAEGDEIFVVDDGSWDGTADHLKAVYPSVHVVTTSHGGLSRARNLGAAASGCPWLVFVDDDCVVPSAWLPALRRAMSAWPAPAGRGTLEWAALGGPNVAPAAGDWRAAVVAACPGAASHVMVDDTEAEHLPGCNLAIRTEVFREIGGFDPRFHTAGDDVDLCWRLRQRGYRIGFVPGAALWHHRRATLRGYLKQQWGYGRAERLLRLVHPQQFTAAGDARWIGCVYGGGPVRAFENSVIYHGPMGRAPYQGLISRTMPARPLAAEFAGGWCRFAVMLLSRVASWLRHVGRLGVWSGGLRWIGQECRQWRMVSSNRADVTGPEESVCEWRIPSRDPVERERLLDGWMACGWKPGPETAVWDLERDGLRLQVAVEHDPLGPCAWLLRVWGRLPDDRTAIFDVLEPFVDIASAISGDHAVKNIPTGQTTDLSSSA